MSRPARILAVVGTRPNFMKIAPILAELRRRPDDFEGVLVHTGQHYDDDMSAIFLDELGVGAPDHLLGAGGGSHAQQTARVMERIEPVILGTRPDLVLVPGDVNSTLAAALVASKLDVPIGHVEAGLRSFDRTMPEEVNRVLCDQISDLLFTHSPEAAGHLAAEGIDGERVFAVGNTMIDTLVAMRERIATVGAPAAHGLSEGAYLIVTLHRPALVDGPLLAEAMAALERVAATLPVVFPAHPRTRAALDAQGLPGPGSGVTLLPPLGYVEFLSLVAGAAGVLTDSGGVQEETTHLGVPCLTLRDNTERPVTVEQGTNVLLGLRPEHIDDTPRLLDDVRARPVEPPAGWDGHAAFRIVDVLTDRISKLQGSQTVFIPEGR